MNGQRVQNLPAFDTKPFHIGMGLGYNQADFFLDRDPKHSFSTDSLQILAVQSAPGFNITMISSFNLSPNFKIRFLPTFIFKERALEYTYAKEPDTSEFWTKRSDKAYFDLPLMFKLRTNRIGNFAAYAIGGAYYSFDLASDLGVNNGTNSLPDLIVKTKKTDYGVAIGGGFDFFLEYFKLGIELKLDVGAKNILYQDNTYFAAPIASLRSKVWTLTFLFEGGRGAWKKRKG